MTTSTPTAPLTPLQTYAEGKVLAATQDRDDAAARVANGLSAIQPSIADLGRFLEATQSAYEVEAWTRFLKQPVESAIMEMHHWARPRGTTPHPVARMVDEAKAGVARRVVEDLAKEDFLDEQALRVFVMGIYGLDA